MRHIKVLFVLLLLAGATRVYADAALLLQEPYGQYGFMNPTGHAAVYLTNVCAASPVELRRCQPGERGVVISRYGGIAGYDWIAMPVIPYLYAVDDPSEIPSSPDKAAVAALRDSYRRAHLESLAPDTAEDKAPGGDWVQLVGASYNRKIYGFEFRTSDAQDDELIQAYNARDNHTHFNLLLFNCADFARTMVNFYYPKATHRSILFDMGITTPKQLAKSLVHYSRKHPDLQLARFSIPQVPGNRPHSTTPRGVVEALLMSKKYLVPLAIFHPFVTSGVAVAYFAVGRFNPAKGAAPLVASEWTDSPIIAGKFQPQNPIHPPDSVGSLAERDEFGNGGSTRDESAAVNLDTPHPVE
ncbi:MAG: hypothetical protein ABSD20_10820 [Terriglobales bacterium]|jgi:hypothetical protein